MNFWRRFKAILVALIWQLAVCLCQKDAIRFASFHKPLFCPNRVPRGYQVSQAVSSLNTLSCTVACASSPVCNSVVFDRLNKTCFLSRQVPPQDCLNMDGITHDRVYLQTKYPCRNGGTPRGTVCECAPGYIGEICELGPMRDCADYVRIGSMQGSTMRTIRPTDSHSFAVYCFNDLVSLMVRRNNEVNFTRPWRDYRDGFGNINDTHWLGLEKLHVLTSQERTYTMRIQIQLKNGTTLYFQYNNATIKDEKSLYQLTFDSVKSGLYPAGDCLEDLRGANFSTYDKDNDGDDSVNCAGRHQGGWWFRGNSCSTCNPTGQLLQPANSLRTGVDSEVFWIRDLGNIAPFRISIRMGSP